VVLAIALFTFYPVVKVLASAIEDEHGAVSLAALAGRLFTEKVWGLGCLGGGARCGVAWNTLALGLACAALCTALGLASALVATRGVGAEGSCAR
jgi:iron(III) transport system permease protein